MQFSIKSPNAILWKTGIGLDQVMELYKSGKVTDEWLICSLGDAPRAVTISVFIRNPSMFNQGDYLNESSQESTEVSSKKESHSVAHMGWSVFFFSLLAYFFLTFIVGRSVTTYMGSGNVLYAFIVILMKGVEALIISGAIVALLGHAYDKVRNSK